jgi:hypothetical protein
MCYSEQLKREAEAHLVEGVGWLLVGYKAVRPPKPDEVAEPAEAPSWWSIHGVPHEYEERESYRYPMRQLWTDAHGYHLAATPEGAWEAARKLCKRPDQLEQVQIIRALVPEDAVDRDDHHCYEVYLLPPGEHETAEDIRAASRGMRRRSKLRARRIAAASRLLAAVTVRQTEPLAAN